MIRLALLLVLALAGCKPANVRTAPVASPGASCYVACTPSLTDTGTRVECDPSTPACWEMLGTDVIPELGRKLLTCEARRQECAGFIRDLNERGVIRAKE